MMKKEDRKANLLFRKSLKEKSGHINTKIVEEIYVEEPVELIFPVLSDTVVIDTEINSSLIDEIIINDLTKLLDDEKDNLFDIEDELKQIEKDEKQLILTDEVEILQKELQSIERKLKLLEERVSQVKNLNFRAFNETNDMQIELFEISEALLNEKLKEIDAQRLKQYIEVIDRLIKLQSDEALLKDKVDEKKEDFEERDKTSDIIDRKAALGEKELEHIEKFNSDIQASLKILQDKIDEPIEVEEKILKYKKLVAETDKILEAIILFSIGNNSKSKSIAAIFKFGALISLGKVISLKTVTEKQMSASMEDLSSYFDQSSKSLDRSASLVSEALNSIEDIKDVFDQQLKSFIGEIPEYQKMFRNILKLENSMIKEQAKIEDSKKSFGDKEKTYSKKIKEYEKITDNI